MKDKTYFLVCLLGFILLVLGIIITLILLLSDRKKEDWEKYDSYILSLFWPPSSCLVINNSACFDKIKNLQIESNFIINGLWPSYSDGEELEVCNKNEDINVDFDEDFTKSLTNLWPGLNSSEKEKWNDEYNKYGYCYIQRIEKDPNTNYKIYFENTTEVFHKGKKKHEYRDLMEYIIPNIEKGIYNVSKEKFKLFLKESVFEFDNPLTYSLICDNNTNEKEVLNEIRFYYDLSLDNLTDQHESEENCTDYFHIYFSNETKQAFNDIYDIYVLVLNWNNVYCSLSKKKECYDRLKKKKLNILMIDSLRPRLAKKETYQWCNLGEDIQVDTFPDDLSKYMDDYWLENNGTNISFWTYKYNRYGYCYSQNNNYSVENYTDYFQTTMDLYLKPNFSSFLKDYFFYPGEQIIKRTDLEDKMKEIFGVGTFAFSCIRDPNDNSKYYLSSVSFKYNKSLDNLTEVGNLDINCSEDITIEFLEYEGEQQQAEGFYENYDMYFFTLSWLPTFCSTKGPKCFNNIKDVHKNVFTMHGLWPNYRNGTLPLWCNGKNDIEIEIKDKTLYEFMMNYYPSTYHTKEYFWGHEYNKHGYCYNQRKKYDTNKYELFFQQIKKMYENYDLGNIFIEMYKDKIQPGEKEINREDVVNYLNEKGFNNNTYLLVCENLTNETEVKPYISEIRFRFDLEFNKLENSTDRSEFDCPEIFYAQFL